jgi:hypothetical protein
VTHGLGHLISAGSFIRLRAQVVGRVHKGLEVLDVIADLRVDHEDLPLQKLVVTKSGATNAKGSHEELDAGNSPSLCHLWLHV